MKNRKLILFIFAAIALILLQILGLYTMAWLGIMETILSPAGSGIFNIILMLVFIAVRFFVIFILPAVVAVTIYLRLTRMINYTERHK